MYDGAFLRKSTIYIFRSIRDHCNKCFNVFQKRMFPFSYSMKSGTYCISNTSSQPNLFLEITNEQVSVQFILTQSEEDTHKIQTLRQVAHYSLETTSRGSVPFIS